MFNFNKTKQKYSLLIKVLLVLASSIYILISISEEQASFNMLLSHLQPISVWYILAFLGVMAILSVANWYFEILKWKTLVSQVHNISSQKAAYQSLVAHAVAVLTPNRIGDYAMKLSFFDPKNHKRILGLNTIQNFAQLLVTLIFGLVGFVVLREMFWTMLQSVQIELIAAIILICLLAIYFLKSFFKNTWNSIQLQLQIDSTIKFKILFYSFLRYLFFSHQYFLLGFFLGWDISYFIAMPSIFIMYLGASFLPSIFIVDATLKAGIGIFIFSFFGVSSYIVLSISLVMWLFNFMLPAAIGNVLMIKSPLRSLTKKEILSV